MKLSTISTKAPKEIRKDDTKKITKDLIDRLAELQRMMLAQGEHSLLIVFQGMDASGKDGVVRNVFKEVSPAACQVKSFKKPNDEEMAHDFLWRVHQHTPEKGMIQIFNRSHYEDVLVQRVHQWVDMDTIRQRMVHINNFESLLTQNNTHIIKVFLHASREEQLERLQERIDLPHKRWKHNANDMKEREHWEAYMEAYEDVLQNCSPDIPWTVVPSDQNWYKEYLVAKTIVEKLESMPLAYPAP